MEVEGRATALGLIALEVTQAEEMPIPNVKLLKKKELEKLANAFDLLEDAARRLGNSNSRKNVVSLSPLINNIDRVVGEVFNFDDDLTSWVHELVSILMDRRISRTGEATPEILKSKKKTLKVKAKRRKRVKNKTENVVMKKLDHWKEI